MSIFDRPIAQDAQIEHSCANGTTFSARADLQGGIRVVNGWEISSDKLVADAIQFGAWHAYEIRPRLTVFRGYGTPEIKIDAPVGEWVKHNGRGMPVPKDARVEFAMRDGEVDDSGCEAHRLDWIHRNQPWDIVAYRVVSDA